MIQSKEVAKRTYRSRAEIEHEVFQRGIKRSPERPLELEQGTINEETLRKIQLLFRAR